MVFLGHWHKKCLLRPRNKSSLEPENVLVPKSEVKMSIPKFFTNGKVTTPMVERLAKFEVFFRFWFRVTLTFSCDVITPQGKVR